MGALSPVHLIIILVVALLVIGPGKLPETGAALGRAIRDFRQAMEGTPDATPPAPTQAVAPASPPPTQPAPATADQQIAEEASRPPST
jgi:sec-independent protein translocase protein TatA